MDLQPVKECECPKCAKSFKTYDDLKNHVITHDPDTNVKCETCHQVFPNPTNLRDHMKIVHSQRLRFPCTFPGCEKNYQNQGDALQHMRIEHTENPVRFPCQICGKEFKRRAHLEIHMPTHTNEKAYSCATCGKGFAQKGHLKTHEKTHLEQSTRPRLHCHACPQTFLSKPGLQRHFRVVHENEMNYPCASCDQRFSTSSHLKVHVEAKHATNKKLTCDKCEYRTNWEVDLALHRKRHEPPENHECNGCRKKFDTGDEYIQHFLVKTLE